MCRRYRCRFVGFLGLQFVKCSVDQRTRNTLTSPEFTLASDQELTFTMISLPNSNSPISVYKTSMLGRTSTLLGFYSLPNNSSASPHTHSICLPAGTYQLVFIASELENAIDSNAMLGEVLLSNSSCIYTSLAGKATVLKPYIITTGLQVLVVQCKAKECSYFVAHRFNETAA